jgi:pyruvate dehydrogenase E2 component (dihydrolipoamide acetyltransferase)
MSFEFRLPDIGEGVAEGEIVRWFVHVGEVIVEDAPLVSVLTDKANVEIPSPRAGKVLQIHAKEGDKVKVGGLLVTIEETGGSPASAAPSAPAAPEAPAPAPPVPPGPPSSGRGGGKSLATPHIRRLAAERGIDLAQIKGSGPGGRITERDLESAPMPAPPAPPEPAPTTAPPAVVAPAAPAAPLLAAPVPSSSAPAPAPSAVPPPNAGPAEVERIPIRGLRRVIAEHMAEAKHRAAHFTYVEEVDATELVRTRDRMSRHFEKQGTKLTYLPFIIRAVVAGLREYPRMNATMDDEREELVVHRRCHIGIATAAPDGLIVPVVRDANTKSVAQLARELQDISERGRLGKLTRAELTGSTFTISSLGALGGLLATPILNYPEVAILGVHKIVRRPVYQADGSLGPAEMMNLSISLDHRVLDGITGAQFLSVVRTNLEDPHLLFLDMA